MSALPFKSRQALWAALPAMQDKDARRVIADVLKSPSSCPNVICPGCHDLPGNWAGWCIRCGVPIDSNCEGDVCATCDEIGERECLADFDNDLANELATVGGPNGWHMADAVVFGERWGWAFKLPGRVI